MAPNVSYTSLENYLHKLSYVSRLNVQVPHLLNEVSWAKHISVCYSLQKWQQNHPFLKRLVTGDEKWIFYNNTIHKKSWGPRMSKPGLRPKKIIFHIMEFQWCYFL